MTLQCKKCKGQMHKTQTIIGGNSKYETYTCDECGFEEQKCAGVLK